MSIATHCQGNWRVGHQGGPVGDGIAAEEEGDYTGNDIAVKVRGLEVEVLDVDLD